MAKHLCTYCERKLPGPVAFCPACDQPTKHASDAQRLEWDLRQWRSHVDRTVAAGGLPASHAAIAVAEASEPVSARDPIRVIEQGADPIRVVAPTEHAPIEHAPVAHELVAPKVMAHEPSIDDEFAYRSCVTCGKTDWIVRTTRNDDDTWNYWCVRCSRSFKTEVRIAHALKPFLWGGGVLGGIVAASVLMLH